MGAAPANQAKLELAAPSENGLLGFNEWPNACELLPDSDIKAVLPQTFKITRNSGNQKLRFLDFGPGPHEMTVLDANCYTGLWLEGTEPDSKLPTTDVTVRVGFAGTVELAKQNYEKFLEEDGACPALLEGLGLDDCGKDRFSTYAFRKGGVAIKVTSSGSYVERFAGQGEGEDAPQAFWRDRVLPEFIKAIAGKLP
jgi:hypothetical protein